MLKSNAFHKFRHAVRVLVLRYRASESGVLLSFIYSIRGGFSKLQTAQHMVMTELLFYLKRTVRPRVNPGYERVEWVCVSEISSSCEK